MPFEKGNKLSPGRTKGVVNKSTKAFKDLIVETFKSLEEKKGYGLLLWATNNQTEFYKIACKLLPLQITGENGSALFTLNIDDKQLSTPSLNGVPKRDN